MNDEGRISPPAKNAVYGFLLLTLAMLVTVLLQKSSLIDGNMARRLIGFFVGILIMLVGNYLPKTRFLKALNWTSPPAATAERLAGWALVLTGAVDVCVYMVTPLSLARALSAYLGAIIVLVILLSGLFLWSKSRSAERHSNLEGADHDWTTKKRTSSARCFSLDSRIVFCELPLAFILEQVARSPRVPRLTKPFLHDAHSPSEIA